MDKKHCVLVALLGAFSGCGSDDPVDFSGAYSINVTNGANGCAFDNWMEGETSSNIAVTITQERRDVTATVEGLTGGFLNLVLGSNVFTGDGAGNEMLLTLYGTRSTTDGNCTYTVNAILDAELSGDLLQGQIRYETATNGNPDCTSIEGCASVQNINGARPPSQ